MAVTSWQCGDIVESGVLSLRDKEVVNMRIGNKRNLIAAIALFHKQDTLRGRIPGGSFSKINP